MVQCFRALGALAGNLNSVSRTHPQHSVSSVPEYLSPSSALYKYAHIHAGKHPCRFFIYESFVNFTKKTI